MRRRWPVLLMMVVACLAGSGCSSSHSRATVRGTVSYDGQDVDRGGIAFIPEGDDSDQPRVRATTDIVDGRYQLDSRRGPYPGKYRVQVYWLKKTGKKVPGEKGHLMDETVQALPDKYNSSSQLTAEVQAGSNTLDFALLK